MILCCRGRWACPPRWQRREIRRSCGGDWFSWKESECWPQEIRENSWVRPLNTLLIIQSHTVDRIKLGFWHSSVGNKVAVTHFSWSSILIQDLKEIYLVEVAATVDKKKLPNDWTKSGGTKVRFKINGSARLLQLFRSFRPRVVMLLDLCKNVSDSSKRRRRTVPQPSNRLNSAFTLSLTQTAPCGCELFGFLPNSIAYSVWQRRRRRSENLHADLFSLKETRPSWTLRNFDIQLFAWARIWRASYPTMWSSGQMLVKLFC